ncbi:uncharacterized protein LOC124147113 [Haliotis rufescens]|uniref:uncharacterized protein LOC124147113 n=1 Tax=Haliotis rufescens TaxID=6454 RepID=UPI00201EC38C|nr:uncharacterized protein LOC124147113 [Haliotis rufescens]
MMSRLREKCIVIFIILTVIGVVQLSLIVRKRRAQSPNPCRRVYGVQWVRDPDTCHRYYICVAGRSVQMPPCPRNYVWSVSGRNCVPDNSRWNDCNITSSSNASTEAASFTMNGRRGFAAVSDRMDALVRIPSPEDKRQEAIRRVYPNHPCVFTKQETLLPHPEYCHWYFNCSLIPREEDWAYLEPLTQECPYPNLFSISTRECTHFREVDCGARKVLQAPCEYRMNQCHQSPCLPCPVRHGSCVGLEDGNHPFPDREWTPKYLVCESNRTVDQKDCPEDTPIFSPGTRKCERLMDIPKQNGGTQPSCIGRHNGYYPDETGRCDAYFRCTEGKFAEHGTCGEGEVFDPIHQRCAFDTATAPCGNTTIDFCHGVQDGFYADPFGRCTMYHHCKHGQMMGYMRCPYGSFSPAKGKCKFSLQIPAPCGDEPNICFNKRDGNYADVRNHCMSYYRCHRNFVVHIDECRNGLVFNHVTGKCDVVNNTPPPCGLAPSCLGKLDGAYPAPLRGCQYYYACENEMFRGYGKCSLRQGGFYFNPTTRECDFPTNICSPCGVKRSNCTLLQLA